MSPRNRLSPIERFKSFASNKIDHNEMPTSQRQSLEQLEPRMMLSAVYTVDTTVDEDNGLGAGAGTSLREAIIAANSTLGLDTILFDTATFGSGTETITLDSLLGELDITDNLSIDASEVSGVTVNGDGNNRVFDIAFGQTVGISSLNIIGGYTTGYGGGIRTGATSAVTLAYVTVDDNTAYLGGGIYSAGALTVINSAISDNHGQYRGGGVFSGDGTSTVITNSTVSGNTAGQGAGVFIKAANLDVTGSTFSGNQAYVGGGVAGFFYSTVTIANSTISGNSSNSGTVGGGGVIAWDNTELLLTNSTVTGNSASSAGGGINKDADSNVTMNNSIVAGNTSDDVNGPGSFYGKNNILSQVSLAGFTNNVDGNQLGVLASDVLDGTLKHNGGYTLTHNLLEDSTALNAGDDTLAAGLLTDQRGVTRFNGTVDIGAVEALNSDTLVVDTLDDELDYDYSDGDLSLREAIFLANTDFGTQTITFDTAVFSGGDDTIMLALGELDITDDVAISASAGNEAIIDADDNSRIFDISANTVSMSHMTLTGGSTSGNGGGIRQASGALTLSNMTIEDNDAERGGGLHLDGVTATITLSTISGNTASNDGAGLYSSDGSVNIAYTTIVMNYAGDDGGGIQIDGGSLTVTNSLIDHNRAEEDGGGLDIDGAATVTVSLSTISFNDTQVEDGGGVKVAEGSSLHLEASTVTMNTANDDGGGIQVDSAYLSVNSSTISTNGAIEDGGGIDSDDGTVVITNSTISNNQAVYSGGGAYFYNSSVTITDSSISGPNYTSYYGGGIAAAGSSVTITRSTISGNETNGRGGGIYVTYNSDVLLVDSTVSGNTADYAGGGIAALYGATVTIVSSTISGNSSTYGGGIEAFGYYAGEEEPSGELGVDDGIPGYVSLSIINSTISGNQADVLGGGLVATYSYATILNSTITGNTADTGGGINHNAYSYITIHNAIVAGNTATTANDIYGLVDSGGFNNLIGDHTSSGGLIDGVNGNIVGDDGTAILAINTILDTTLADNGGPTLTHALVSGSKAIDAGGNSYVPNDDFDLNGNTITLETLPFDQRGESRIVTGTVDIGAFELQNVAPDDLAISNNIIPENSADDTELGTVTVSDINTADTHTFSLINDAGGRFDIDANTGVVTVEDGSLLDHETNDSHVITVETTDSGSLTFSKDVTITISDVNEAPTDLSISDNTVPENSADDTEVGTVTVSDIDDGDTHTFSLTDDAGGRFDIDANTGVVTVEDGSLLDHETNGSHVITVETTDSGSLTFSKDVTITITDVNEAPTDLDISPSSVPENSADDTEVGTVTVSDVDDGDTHTFSLINDAGGRFDIDANTGVVTVEDGSLLDHETNDSHVITVETTDSGTLSFTKDVTITISDVNEAPDDLAISNNIIPENSADDTEVGTVTVSDIDAGDTHTFSLTDDAGGRFDIDANTGVVTVEDGSLLDHETNGSHVITVETTDSGSLTISKDVTITISDVNEAPTDLAISADTVPENSTDDTEVGTVTVSDIDAGDTHTFSLTDDAGGRFDIDANTGVVTVEDGSLLDHETNGSHVITVETTDSGSLTFSKDVTITITDVNEAPTDLDLSPSTVPENAADDTEVGTVTVSDVDAGDTHTFSLTNDAGGRFDIDANTGVVTAEDGSLLDHETNDSHVITVETTDSGTLSFTKDVTITISDVNEAPDDLAISNNIIPENSSDDTEVGTVTVSDIDEGDTHTFSLTDDAGGRFDIDANTGVVTVEDGSLLDHETNGSHVITVETADSGSLTISKDVTITISDVNEAPTDLAISANIVAENATDDTEVGTVTVSDIDAGDTHTFSLTDDAGGRFDIDANTGVVTVEDGSLLDHETNDSHVITVETTDSGSLTFSKDVTITITDVNEAPTDLDIAPSSVPENSADDTEVGTVTVSDIDAGDTHTFSLTDDAGGRFDIDANTGVVTVEDGSLLDHETNDSHVITVETTDSGTLSFTKDVTITISDVNEAPDDLAISNNNIPENSADDTEVGTVTVSDIDAGDTHTFSLTDDAGGRFDIDANTGVVTVEDSSLLDHETNGSHVITVETTDSGSLTFSKDVTITISDVNEAPTDLAISNDIIPEDIGDDGEVGSISVTDEDDGDSHTFDLTDDAGGRFAIDPNTGEITVVDGDLIDFDVNASHDITVEVTDSGTLTFSKDITILVTKVFFAPTDITLDNNEVNEGAANGSLVGTVAAVDVPGETNTYQLTDDAGGRFAIDSATGEITVLDSTLIDFDTNASHDITVRATNSALESFDKTFTINVNDASGLLIPLKMPHGMRVGSKLVGTMKVKITNDSGIDFVKAGDLDVKLIARPTAGSPDVVLDQRSVNANWTSGKTKDWYFNLNYDGLPVGEYQLFGEVCYDNVATLDHVELFASEDRNGDPFLLTVGATHFVDLVGRVETASQNPGSVKAGTTVKTRLLVNIENNGSLPVGPRSIDIAVYAEDTLGNRLPAPVATMTGLHLAYLRPSGRLPVWVHATFPAGVTPANYHFIVEVDSGNDVAESNPGGTGESNNDDNISRRNVNVRRGDIDLVGAISDSKGTPTYASGSAIEDERVFALQNLGNVATPAGATADLVMNIYNSLDVLVRTQTIESHAIGNHIPGTTRFVFALLDQPALAADNYRVEVEIQPENFTDSVLGNNTFEFFFDVV